MGVPWDVVLSTVGGVAAAVVGVLVGGLVSRRGQNLVWLRDTQAAACAAVLREFAHVEVELRSAYYSRRTPRVDWAPWGASLAGLSLICSPEVSDKAGDLTEVMAAFETFVNGSPDPDDEGLANMSDRIVAAQMAFVNAARRSLDSRQKPLTRQLGGPPTT